MKNLIPTSVIMPLFMVTSLCSWGAPGLVHASSHRVVGKVDLEAISHEDVLERLRFMLAMSGQAVTPALEKQFYPQVLETLIDEALQRKAAEKQKISVTEAEINQRISDIEENGKLKSGQLKKMLSSMGIREKTLRNQVEASLLWMLYIEQKYGPFLRVSEQDIKRVQEKWEKEHQSMVFQLAEIVLEIPEPSRRSAVEAHGKDLKKLLDEGTPFAKLAQQFSESSTRNSGGLTEWKSLTHFDALLHPFLLKGEIGVIFGPLLLPSKEHPTKIMLFVLVDRKDPKTLNLKPPTEAEVRSALYSELLTARGRKEMRQLRMQQLHEVVSPPSVFLKP
jgi:parvulin-like peptidyl-prolyl isomerase